MPAGLPPLPLHFPPPSLFQEFMTAAFRIRTKPRPPNAFFIYRRAYIIFLNDAGYSYRNFQMSQISTMVSAAWKLESEFIKDRYFQLSKEIDKALKYLESSENVSKKHGRSFDYSKFSNIKKIAKGGHGTVFSATYCGEKIVLKKHTNVTNVKGVKRAAKELKLLSTVNGHQNIIPFVGTTVDPETSSFAIISKFANGGSLRDHLQSKIDEGIFKISWKEVIQLAEQIILGLQHLHGQNIIHGDLTSKNILVNDGIVWIADFGLSSKIDDNSFSISQGGSTPYEYADPQRFVQIEFFEPNTKSDIYSLGLVLWELTSGTPPFWNIANKQGLGWFINFKGLQNEIIPETPTDYAMLCKKCWNITPNERPELHEVLHTIRRSKEVAEIITNKVAVLNSLGTTIEGVHRDLSEI